MHELLEDIFLEFSIVDKDCYNLPWATSIFLEMMPTAHYVDSVLRMLQNFSTLRSGAD